LRISTCALVTGSKEPGKSAIFMLLNWGLFIRF